jgi:hypothetical protein
MKQQKIALAVGGVLLASAGFLAGMEYSRMNVPSRVPRGDFAGMRGAQGGARMMGGGFVTGEVLSKDDKSVTVKSRDGGSRIVFYSGSTHIGKSVDGVIDDIAVGSRVLISGTANSDGSISAQTITMNPAMPSGMMASSTQN